MTRFLDRPLVPIAGPDDAEATYDELRRYLLETDVVPIVVHVIEKAGGAPDKASVEQREEHAEEAFRVFREHASIDGIDIETKLLYGTDVAEAIHDAAAEMDASAIVFRSRGGSRWLDRLSGGVRSKLISNSDHPVIVLPQREEQA